MTTVIVIAAIIFVIYLAAGKSKPKKTNIPKHEPKIQIKVTVNSGQNKKDESIIDVTGNSYAIKTDNNSVVSYENGVPSWAHQYVYSYSEINSATSEQKKFYEFFKIKFLSGVYLDLEGNTNYSFILLFDLLNEYDNHKDLAKLENQFNALGKYYPKTKSYAKDFLLKKMEQAGDEKGIERLKSQDSYSYGIYSRDYIDEYHLGNKYAKKLKLSQEDISWLNKFWNPNNVFISIEGCCIATIKLYLEVIKGLDTRLKAKNTTLAKEVDFFQSEIIKLYKANNSYGWSGYDVTYLKSRAESEVFGTIFKRAESKLREVFGHKRKISSDFPYSDNKLQQEFENRIGATVNEIILSIAPTLNVPDEKTEIELNAQNVNRWKIKFETLTESFNEQSKEKFIEQIHELEKINQGNPSIENIFYEASKFIAKIDKVASLKFYIHYLYYDLKSSKVDNKQLNKTIQKNLFKNNEQLKDFEKIIAELVKSKKLKNAIEQVEKIYEPKRKKIKLDKTAIKEVQKQDKGTVEILNEYLKDEYEDETTSIKTEEINDEEVKIEITNKSDNQLDSPFSVTLNQIQTEVLFLFANRSYSIPNIEIESFCKSKGVFKGQLIDSINECCYEILDDVIIEENGESYILSETYYQKISVK